MIQWRQTLTIPPIREQYLSQYGGYTDLAAIGLARDLQRGDPERLKAGYTLENAIIATLEIFPEANVVDLEREAKFLEA